MVARMPVLLIPLLPTLSLPQASKGKSLQRKLNLALANVSVSHL